MQPSEVLFVGGDVDRLASIKIRCREIAQRLGCDCVYKTKSVHDVPRGYKAYICVKPEFSRAELPELARHGAVVWDILDDLPPAQGVHTYIASTAFVKTLYNHLGPRIVVIHHYHCNFSGEFNDGTKRLAAYIGSDHWYPQLDGVNHQVYFVHRWTREQLVPVYRQVGISLNLRNLSVDGEKWVTVPTDITPMATKHIMLNSGMKLINCIGFGLPSVSSVEPAYMEIAPQCTVFTDQRACAEHLQTIASDDGLYNRIRGACISEAKRFSIENILEHYRALIRSL